MLRRQLPGDKAETRQRAQQLGRDLEKAWGVEIAAQQPDLRALAGLRALACLGILAGHLAYWVSAANPDKHQVPPLTCNRQLRRQPLHLHLQLGVLQRH